MNEIDDDYDSNMEMLEQEFFEGIGSGKKRRVVLEEYLRNLDSIRKKRELDYKKYLREKKEKIWKKKREKKKREKFKHLKIERFDFNFNIWERFVQKFEIKIFILKRFILKNLWQILPIPLIYWYYRSKKDVSSLFISTTESFGNVRKKIVDILVNWSIKSWRFVGGLFKKTWKSLERIWIKLILWKKKKEDEGISKEKEQKKSSIEGENTEKPIEKVAV